MQLTDREEWIGEVIKRRDEVDQGRVYITKINRPAKSEAPIDLLIVTAAAVVPGGPIIRFTRLVGTLWGLEQDHEITAAATGLVERLETDVVDAGLVPAAGYPILPGESGP